MDLSKFSPLLITCTIDPFGNLNVAHRNSIEGTVHRQVLSPSDTEVFDPVARERVPIAVHLAGKIPLGWPPRP